MISYSEHKMSLSCARHSKEQLLEIGSSSVEINVTLQVSRSATNAGTVVTTEHCKVLQCPPGGKRGVGVGICRKGVTKSWWRKGGGGARARTV